MSNVVGNAFAILFLLVVIVGLAIGLTVTNSMMRTLTPALNGVASGYGDSSLTIYDDLKNFFLVNFSFLVYLIVLLVFYTSFGTENTIKSYLSMIMAGTIMTVIMSQMATLIWNNVSAGALIDFSDFGAELWFISNIQSIFIVNLLIALCSFVFIPRAPKGVAQ